MLMLGLKEFDSPNWSPCISYATSLESGLIKHKNHSSLMILFSILMNCLFDHIIVK